MREKVLCYNYNKIIVQAVSNALTSLLYSYTAKKVNDAKFRAFQKLGILYQNDTVRYLHTFAGFCISGAVFTEGAKLDKIFTYLLFGGICLVATLNLLSLKLQSSKAWKHPMGVKSFIGAIQQQTCHYLLLCSVMALLCAEPHFRTAYSPKHCCWSCVAELKERNEACQ